MKKYSVAKNFRLTRISMIIGFLLFFPALISLIRFHHASDLSLASTRLRNGSYVNCQIDRYYVLPLSVNGEKTSILSGRLGGFSLNGTDDQYVVYYAILENGKYLRIAIQDPDLLSSLDDFDAGAGEPVRFLGKILWHRDNFYTTESRLKWEGFDVANYTPNYYVLQINKKSELERIKKRLAWGAAFMLLSILLFALGMGVTPVRTMPLEETTEYVRLAKVDHYALEEELEQKKRKVAVLQEQLPALRKWALLGILIMLSGISVLLDVHLLWLLPQSLSLVGWLIVLAGAEMVWYAFINSNTSLALRIADRFTLETRATKLKKEEIFIGVLSHRIDNEKHMLRMRAKEDRSKTPPVKQS